MFKVFFLFLYCGCIEAVYVSFSKCINRHISEGVVVVLYVDGGSMILYTLEAAHCN